MATNYKSGISHHPSKGNETIMGVYHIQTRMNKSMIGFMAKKTN